MKSYNSPGHEWPSGLDVKQSPNVHHVSHVHHMTCCPALPASADGGGAGGDQEEGRGVWEARWHWGVAAGETTGESEVEGELGMTLSLSLSLSLVYPVLQNPIFYTTCFQAATPFPSSYSTASLNLILLPPPQLAEWWSQVAYLGYRLPVPVHVSPAICYPPQPAGDTDTYLRWGHVYVHSCVLCMYMCRQVTFEAWLSRLAAPCRSLMDNILPTD